MEGEAHVLLDGRGRYLATGLVLTDDVEEAIRFPGTVDAAWFATRFGCNPGLSVQVASVRTAA